MSCILVVVYIYIRALLTTMSSIIILLVDNNYNILNCIYNTGYTTLPFSKLLHVAVSFWSFACTIQQKHLHKRNL